MGLFDSLVDMDGYEWQTKQFGSNLDQYQIGDRIRGAFPGDFQVKVIGGPGNTAKRAYATIRAGRLVEVPARRRPSLKLHGDVDVWEDPDVPATVYEVSDTDLDLVRIAALREASARIAANADPAGDPDPVWASGMESAATIVDAYITELGGNPHA